MIGEFIGCAIMCLIVSSWVVVMLELLGWLRPICIFLVNASAPVVIGIGVVWLKARKALIEAEEDKYDEDYTCVLSDDNDCACKACMSVKGEVVNLVDDFLKTETGLKWAVKTGEHASDEFDRRTASGERLNLITGQYEH